MFYALENFKVNHVSVDPDIISRPGPRFEAVTILYKTLVKLLHPEI